MVGVCTSQSPLAKSFVDVESISIDLLDELQILTRRSSLQTSPVVSVEDTSTPSSPSPSQVSEGSLGRSCLDSPLLRSLAPSVDLSSSKGCTRVRSTRSREDQESGRESSESRLSLQY